MLRHHSQLVAKGLRVDRRALLRRQPQPVERREHMGATQPVEVVEQGGPLFGPDVLGHEIVGEGSCPGAKSFPGL